MGDAQEVIARASPPLRWAWPALGGQAVRGDVPGRPAWSEYVVVETDAGPLRLGGFDVGVPVLVSRIQAWAGVGEQPADPHSG